MCGLVVSPLEGVAPAMVAKISHRGVRSRCEDVGGWSLGHTRLPIQGVSDRFDQPYHHGDWVILYVGEIFNYKMIDPKAESDVQVLADRWESHGVDAFSAFDGFWSVVALDKWTREVHVVTDFLAKKPLYIHLPTSTISSEMKPLLVSELGRWEFDPLYMSSVCKWGYHIGDRTPFSTIRKVPPGTHMIINQDGEVSVNRCYSSVCSSRSDLFKEISMACLNRLVSDVPVGVLVSGGIDSSIVFKLVQMVRPDITVFHVDNGEEEFLGPLLDGTSVKVVKLGLDDVWEDDVLVANETPVDLGSMVPQYALSKAIRSAGFDVVLSGDGADEVFGGYTRIADYDSQHTDVFEELVYYHLPRLDRLMMAHTVELRCPFLARPVVEHGLSLPYADRMKKKVLKELFSGLVPEAIISRRKKALKSRFFLDGGIDRRYRLVKRFQELFDERK